MKRGVFGFVFLIGVLAAIIVMIVVSTRPAMVKDLKPGVYRAAADVVVTSDGVEGNFDLLQAKDTDGVKAFLDTLLMGAADPNAGCATVRSIRIRVRQKDVITMGSLPAPKDATMYIFIDAENGKAYLVTMPKPAPPEGAESA